jgi:hypothetical protein
LPNSSTKSSICSAKNNLVKLQPTQKISQFLLSVSTIKVMLGDQLTMKTITSAFLIALLFAEPSLASPSSDKIGHIQNLQGTASILRDGRVSAGVVGSALYRGDLVRTGKPGAVGIVLTDDTSISLGSGSELSLNDYAFEPKESKFALGLRMIKGTFSYISGQIVKLAPGSAQLHTPDATIAVRGTKLLIEIKE